jgi:hypothetical protein
MTERPSARDLFEAWRKLRGPKRPRSEDLYCTRGHPLGHRFATPIGVSGAWRGATIGDPWLAGWLDEIEHPEALSAWCDCRAWRVDLLASPPMRYADRN